MNVHKRVKIYRELVGLTQAKMAESLNITTQAYALKERGLRGFKTGEMLTFKLLVNRIDPSVTIDDIFF